MSPVTRSACRLAHRRALQLGALSSHRTRSKEQRRDETESHDKGAFSEHYQSPFRTPSRSGPATSQAFSPPSRSSPVSPRGPSARSRRSPTPAATPSPRLRPRRAPPPRRTSTAWSRSTLTSGRRSSEISPRPRSQPRASTPPSARSRKQQRRSQGDRRDGEGRGVDRPLAHIAPLPDHAVSPERQRRPQPGAASSTSISRRSPRWRGPRG